MGLNDNWRVVIREQAHMHHLYGVVLAGWFIGFGIAVVVPTIVLDMQAMTVSFED